MHFNIKQNHSHREKKKKKRSLVPTQHRHHYQIENTPNVNTTMIYYNYDHRSSNYGDNDDYPHAQSALPFFRFPAPTPCSFFFVSSCHQVNSIYCPHPLSVFRFVSLPPPSSSSHDHVHRCVSQQRLVQWWNYSSPPLDHIHPETAGRPQ